MHYGSEQHLIIYFPSKSGVIEWASEQTNERSSACEQSKHCGASKWMSGAVQANGRVSSPVLRRGTWLFWTIVHYHELGFRLKTPNSFSQNSFSGSKFSTNASSQISNSRFGIWLRTAGRDRSRLPSIFNSRKLLSREMSSDSSDSSFPMRLRYTCLMP